MELPSRHPKYQTPPECGSAPSGAAPVSPDPREELQTPPPLPRPGKGCCARADAKEHRQRAALTRRCCQRHSQFWKLRLGQARAVQRGRALREDFVSCLRFQGSQTRVATGPGAQEGL